AYYVALAADHIVAHPTTLTGSIGVLVQSINARELGEKIGVRDVTIKSGPDKDILNPLGELTPAQRTMLQNIVDTLHARFVTLVAERRGLNPARVQSLADGRIMTAERAASFGLIDEIGYWEDAVRRTAELLEADEIKVYRYEEEFSLSAFLRAAQRWNPEAALRRLGGTRLLYHGIL
ncbi:MAG: S49 family peptidase, partial [Lentisphaerae bacterium]|nr:S49 family peptidase [Lentisphaerota bacterium]